MIGPQGPLRWCSIRVAPRVPKDHESTVNGGSGLGATFRGRALHNDTTIVMLGGEKPARVQDTAQRQGAQSVELGEEAHPQKFGLYSQNRTRTKNRSCQQSAIAVDSSWSAVIGRKAFSKPRRRKEEIDESFG